MSLIIKNLKATVASSNMNVLSGLNLVVKPGEFHIIMGPNGSGKSSLSKVMMSHPDYDLESGSIELDNLDITDLEPDEISKAGLFLANQYPQEVPGVNLTQFLRLCYQQNTSDNISLFKFRNMMRQYLKKVGLPESFLERNLNEGFSGGEKKKCEILQMLILKPKYAVLDETDSGLDLSAQKQMFDLLYEIVSTEKQLGVIFITHYLKVLELLEPTKVHLMIDGNIVESGGAELAKRLEKDGYSKLVVEE